MRSVAVLAVVVQFSLVGALAVPSASAEEPDRGEQAEDMAKDAIEQLMRALELMIESIPQYEMPEINENGDIIIRRKRPHRPSEPGPSRPPEVDETTT